jgi:hypothetical protein
MDKFLAKARTILTPRQLGRMIVFQDRFELELLETVRALRRSGMGPPGGPPPEMMKQKQ